jgi:hypothetical protein
MASAYAATEATMASSAHFYLNCAKERIDEMDAVLTSLESKSTQITASARTVAEGMGMELSIARTIVKAQNGQISAETGTAAVRCSNPDSSCPIIGDSTPVIHKPQTGSALNLLAQLGQVQVRRTHGSR